MVVPSVGAMGRAARKRDEGRWGRTIAGMVPRRRVRGAERRRVGRERNLVGCC